VLVTNRVHIDALGGVVEIEGEKDFVEGLLTKVFPLREKAGFGSRPLKAGEAQPNDDNLNKANEEDIADDVGNSGKPKLKRKRSVAPKGHSCADRMILLKDEGFFKAKRTSGEIVAGLAEKGFTHKSNQVAAAGESLFNRGLLQRTKDGSGPFKYFWDRE
jgi:hypothetical protein